MCCSPMSSPSTSPAATWRFHRWAFELVGGFDPEYRKAGDDVDFCWRLQNAGQVIAFSASAIVWHYRRFTLAAFRKQQEGYGEAESLLRFNHLVFFGPTGTAQWKGNIYGAPRFTWLVREPVVYHGVFGHGLFQSIYPTPRSVVADYVSSVEWFALTGFIFLLAIPFEHLRIVPFLMFGATFTVALAYMVHARLEARFDTIPARLLVMVLAFTQPLVRGWARYYTWLRFKRTPGSVITAPHAHGASPARWLNLTRRRYTGTRPAWAARRSSPKSSRPSPPRAGATAPTRVGNPGTSRFTATCGGTCVCAPSPSTTAARSA